MIRWSKQEEKVIKASAGFYVKLVMALLFAALFIPITTYIPHVQTSNNVRLLIIISVFLLFFPLTIRNWFFNLVSYLRYLFIFVNLTYAAFVALFLYEGYPFSVAMSKPFHLARIIFEATMPVSLIIVALICLLMLLLAIRKHK